MIAVAARLGVVVRRVVSQRQCGDAAIPEGRIHVSRLRPVDPRLRHRQPQAQRTDVHIEPPTLYQSGDRQRRQRCLGPRQLTQIDAQPLRILVVDLDIVALCAKQQRIAPFPVMVDIHINLLPAGRHVIIEVKRERSESRDSPANSEVSNVTAQAVSGNKNEEAVSSERTFIQLHCCSFRLVCGDGFRLVSPQIVDIHQVITDVLLTDRLLAANCGKRRDHQRINQQMLVRTLADIRYRDEIRAVVDDVEPFTIGLQRQFFHRVFYAAG